ncbi:sulfotransferase family 2 domain-containing protein [Marinobacterium mangrovicola]|uniref:Sulfotransferase family protein n=1 Tax=Marinobacterium mangrovicola TaxID=1476959 RepID=A0A4R1GGS1_9GAMM|nr:sulfotransferase family 2 domain-containing protein [Marinobacterium mangrovicola]TCK07258.1 sulfotransferase family protein [Marinobacterium mangrovicola]
MLGNVNKWQKFVIKRFIKWPKKDISVRKSLSGITTELSCERKRTELDLDVKLPMAEDMGEAKNTKALFFVHIPKTAGTSFRKAAEEYFSFESVCYDYSLDSAETSDLVRKFIYEEKDYLGLNTALSETEILFISGHVPAKKYVHLLGASQLVTFLRDPVQRVLSEYNHFLRHKNYEGDLPSFYRKPQFINRHSKMLHGLPIEALGFIGLTEDYDVSLSQLNALFGTAFQRRKLNQGREAKDKAYEVPDDQLKEMQELNAVDIALYQKVVELYKQRYALFVKGLPYVHGTIQQLNSKVIKGWAWYAQGERAVTIEVLVDDKKVADLVANDLCPGLLHLSPPRNGYIGFHYRFSKPLGAGVNVSVRVSETEQVLGQQEVVVV